MIHPFQRIAILLAALVLSTGTTWAADTYQPDAHYKPSRNLARFFAKIAAGQPVVVMGIGGSVTEGHSWAAIERRVVEKTVSGPPDPLC